MDTLETEITTEQIQEMGKEVSEEEAPKKASYLYGNLLGNVMGKVDTRTQYEASMLSITFMMFGMFVTAFYLIVYSNLPIWYRWFLSANVVAGVVFMSSFLITTFQQYRGYMEVLKFQIEMKGGDTENAKKS